MKTVLDQIEASHFIVKADVVEKLAAEQYQASKQAVAIAATYLRILIAVTRQRIKRKGNQLDVLNEVHAELYPAILKGVHTPDLLQLTETERTRETNRRATFARSTVSTIRTYLHLGGDLKSLDIRSVTKFDLYKAFRPPEPADRTERTVQRAERSLVGALRRMASKDAPKAETEIERLLDELRELLETLTKPVSVISTKLTKSRTVPHAHA